jgi:hypothetical protein
MKKQIYMVLTAIIIICLPNIEGLLTVNNHEEIETVKLDDNVPVWELGDSWIYNINRFQTNFYASGAFIGIDSYVDELNFEVIGYSETSYISGISGIIKGTFQYETGEGIVLKGNLLFTKLSGNIYFRKNDLAIEKTQIIIKGIVLITEHLFQIKIPIPLPLTITVNINQTISRPIIDFPLYDGKQGFINETVISANIKFESVVLQILSFFFEDIPYGIYYKETFNIPMLNYSTKTENISIGSETYNAYNISFAWDLFGSIYYAPSVRNIVKTEAVIEVPDKFMVLCIAELKDYN